jgi:hypothetical protein
MRGRPKKYNTEEERLTASKEWWAKRVAKKQADPSIRRNEHLRHTYGITLDDYNQMLFNQNGCCAICQKHHTEFKYSLYVDHCHDTNQVRGLLCHLCNSGIGYLKDDTKILKQAIIYLNHYKLK